jgi:hypothetical protein
MMKIVIAAMILMGVVVYGQNSDITSYCSNHECTSSTVVNGTSIITRCDESGCTQDTHPQEMGYVQRFCLSCTKEDTLRSRALFRLAFWGDGKLDATMLHAYLQENDAALIVEMQRSSWLTLLFSEPNMRVEK